jgi:hypothetical protein
MKRTLVVVVAALFAIVGTSCTTPLLGPPPIRPTTLLDGWSMVAQVGADVPGNYVGDDVLVSPNARYVAYMPQHPRPGDAEPPSGDLILYLWDRETDVHHLVTTGQLIPHDVTDDGRLLFQHVTPYSWNVYTIEGGIDPIAKPAQPHNCLMGFEPNGPGFELQCSDEPARDTTPSTTMGLYRFDDGDTAATPIAVPPNPTDDDLALWSVSPDRRYLEVVNPLGPSPTGFPLLRSDIHAVYDTQTSSYLPFSFRESNYYLDVQNTTRTVRSHWPGDSNPVTNDGRLLLDSDVFSTVLLKSYAKWFDPHDGSFTSIDGFPQMHVTKFFDGTNLFNYDDWAPEMYKNHILEGRPNPTTIPVLGDVTDPTKRWTVPSGGHVEAIAPDGDLIAVTAADPDGWVTLMVREGALP